MNVGSNTCRQIITRTTETARFALLRRLAVGVALAGSSLSASAQTTALSELVASKVLDPRPRSQLKVSEAMAQKKFAVALRDVAMNHALVEQTRVTRDAAAEGVRASEIERDVLQSDTPGFRDVMKQRKEQLVQAEREAALSLADYYTSRLRLDASIEPAARRYNIASSPLSSLVQQQAAQSSQGAHETCFCIGIFAADANGTKPLPAVTLQWDDRVVTPEGLVVKDPAKLVRLIESNTYDSWLQPETKPAEAKKPVAPPSTDKPAPKEPEKAPAEKPPAEKQPADKPAASPPPVAPPAAAIPPAPTPPTAKPPTSEPPLPSLDDLLGTGDQRRPGDPAPDPAEADLDRLLSGEEIGDAFKEAAMLMGDASKRLNESKDASLTTQRLQESIVRRLDQLLSSLDQMQQQQSSSSQQQSQQQQQQQNVPKQQDSKRNEETKGENDGQATMPPGRKDGPIRPGLDAVRSSWGRLPERVRDMLVQGSSDRFSSIYEGMTEAYYKKLAEQGKAK